MADKTWKACERRVGRIFGVRRKIGSGCDLSRPGGDLDHETCYVEVKMRKNHGAVKFMREVLTAAAKEGKIPVLVLFEKGDATPYLVAPLNADHLLRLGRILLDARTVTPVPEEGDKESDGETV